MCVLWYVCCMAALDPLICTQNMHGENRALLVVGTGHLYACFAGFTHTDGVPRQQVITTSEELFIALTVVITLAAILSVFFIVFTIVYRKRRCVVM